MTPPEIALLVIVGILALAALALGVYLLLHRPKKAEPPPRPLDFVRGRYDNGWGALNDSDDPQHDSSPTER